MFSNVNFTAAKAGDFFKALNSTSQPIRTILFKQLLKKETDISTVSVIIKRVCNHPLNPVDHGGSKGEGWGLLRSGASYSVLV